MREAVISFPLFGENFSLNPPSAITIGGFSIYFYGLIIALGMLLAVVYVSRFHKRLGFESMDEIYDLMLFAVPSAIVGARLYYVIFYWSLYAGDFWSIFRIRDGGLAIYGGIIGAVIALILRCRRKKISVWKALDVAGFGLLIGQSVGRWGNFFNREAYGYETEVFCRMGLTPPGGATVYVHPAFLYESLWNALGLLILHQICKKHRRYEGQFFLLYVAWYGLGRTFIEGLRSDSLWLVPDVIRVSQLLAAVTCILAVSLLLVNASRLKKGRGPLVGRAIDGCDIIEARENASQESPESGDNTPSESS